MIQLTRLNGNSISVNCDLIRYAESSPDTVLSLVTGEKLLVREPADEVAARIFRYRVSVLRSAWPDAATALGARHAYDTAHAEPQPFFDRD